VDSGPALLLGGRYRLGQVLGRGGAATVYEAFDVALGRPVAVKCFRLGSSRSSLHRFGVEARLLANLSHPGLVTVHDVSLEGEQPYLVMRLVTGATLREVLDEGPLAPTAVAGLGARLADVFAYVHTCDVVHRDLKPSNVLIDESGAPYLTDFGLARALSAAHVTPSGDLVGTAAYLAPEQVSDAGAGPPADVYSLGLVLLESLTGEPEYQGTTAEVAVARLSRRPRVPHSLGPGWRAVLTAMTERDPADRPTAARCAELLAAIAEGRARTSRRPAQVGLVVTALAMAAAVAIPVVVVVPGGVPGQPVGEPTREPLPEARPPVGLAASLGAAEAAVVAPPAVAAIPQPAQESTQESAQAAEDQGRHWGGRGGFGRHGRHGGRGR
jgi:hypothetical protein